MKNSRLKFHLIFSLSMLFYLPAIAAEIESDVQVVPEAALETSVPPVAEDSNSRFNVGLRAVDFDYQEPGVMSDRGILSGVAGSYFYRLNESSLFRADAEYLKGDVHYDGGLQDGQGSSIPYQSQDRFQVFNASFVAMTASDLTQKFVTAPFIGLGFRNTFDGKDGQYDYRRDITYIYLIMGPQFELIHDHRQSLLLTFELDTLLGGEVKTYLSDVPRPGNPRKDLTMKFKSGSAWRVGLEHYFNLPNSKKLMTEVSFKKWDISDSEPLPAEVKGYYYVEPRNTTALTTVTVGMNF